MPPRHVEATPGGLGALGWDALHMAALALLCLVSLRLGFGVRSPEPDLTAVAWWALVVFGLIVSHRARHAILELLGEMRYRERFLAFLAHLVAMLLPRLVLDLRGWEHALSALMVFIAFHAVSPVQFGRLMAVSALQVVVAISAAGRVPEWMPVLWLGLLIVALRMQQVRTTLEANAAEIGPAPVEEIRRIGAPLLAGLASAAVAWAIALFVAQWTPKRLEFRPFAAGPQGALGPVGLSAVLWDAFFIVLGLAFLIGVLAWLDKKLRSRQRGRMQPDSQGLSSMRLENDPVISEDRLEREAPGGARERVLAAFAQLSRRLEPRGLARMPSEPSEAYLGRLATRGPEEAQRREVPSIEVFQVACYSHELEPSIEDAETFEAAATRLAESILHEYDGPARASDG